ncbi:MAG: IS4 family transposase [Chloroflexi bacterium]|nr:IS4 family transposase [Chloroflexota bacterium]
MPKDTVRTPKRTRRFAANVEKARKRLEEKPLAFEKALSMELVSQAITESKLEYRQRKFPPWLTLWAFVWQMLKGYASCADAVIQIAKWHLEQGNQPCSPDSGHYCEARRRLSLDFLRTLLRLQYEAAMRAVPRAWKWLGKHDVKVVDGTTFMMADSEANREAFPPQEEPSPGTRYPIMRAVGLFSLTLGLLKDFAYGPYEGKGTGESSLFRRLLGHIDVGDVILGDKYYCSYRDVHQILNRGAHVVVKHFKHRTTLEFVKRLGKNDAIYRWKRPRHARQEMSAEEYARLPEELLVRIVKVRVKIPGFRVDQFEVLTTLLDAKEYSADAIAELFFRRWRVEVYIDDFKTSLGLEMLRCKSPAMIAKELTVAFLAYNTIRIQMAQAAECLEVPLHEISFTTTMNAMITFRDAHRPEEIATKLATIVQTRVGHRPGRSEPRAVKRRSKPYNRLKQGRPTFTENVET